MDAGLEKFAALSEICRKICLNIPPCAEWQWDRQRGMALLTLEREDSELVYLPLITEFKQHWDFSSPVEAETLISRLISAEYGLMPGQTFFVSRPVDDTVLFVAWWPWGVADRISMRVGLFPIGQGKPRIDSARSLTCLRQWLKIPQRAYETAQ